MYHIPHYHVPGSSVVVWGGGVNNLCTVETEDTINAQQLKNCLARCEMLMKYITFYLEDSEFSGRSFEKSPIHFLKEPVLDLLNNALNIIRDFCLERYPCFPANAITYIEMINTEKNRVLNEDKMYHAQWVVANKTLHFLHAYMSSDL